jgi:hypothetical protein
MPSMETSNCAPVIAVDPVPDVAKPLVLEHLTEITAVDPATTGRTPDEMLRFVLRWIANALAEVFFRAEH